MRTGRQEQEPRCGDRDTGKDTGKDKDTVTGKQVVAYRSTAGDGPYYIQNPVNTHTRNHEQTRTSFCIPTLLPAFPNSPHSAAFPHLRGPAR